MTNRIGNAQQIPKDAPPGHDMLAHRKFGLDLQKRYGTEAIDITDKHLLSGVVMCFTAPVLGKLQFCDGFFGIDNAAHREVKRLGKKILLLRGLYVQHFYRADGVGHKDAPKAKRL
jgi:hypothetical protein